MSRAGEIVVVSPEHVEIVLSPAGLGSRFLATAVDAMLTYGLPFLVVRLLAPVLSAGVSLAVQMSLQFFFTFGYHVYFETVHHGRSPGKRAMRLRVIDARGLPITPAQSLVRNALRAIDSLPVLYGCGALVSLLDARSRRLGDIAADTLVIEEQAPAADADLGGIAERRFNSLRTPRVARLIRHRIGLEERELLLELCVRADGLEPGCRYELFEEFASHYSRVLDIDDPRLSGENLVRDLTGLLFANSSSTPAHPS